MYLGKKGKLVFVFTPVAASSYKTMEMNEVECQNQLSNFRVVADTAAGGNFYECLKDIKAIEAQSMQAQVVEEKNAEYPTFGSW